MRKIRTAWDNIRRSDEEHYSTCRWEEVIDYYKLAVSNLYYKSLLALGGRVLIKNLSTIHTTFGEITLSSPIWYRDNCTDILNDLGIRVDKGPKKVRKKGRLYKLDWYRVEDEQRYVDICVKTPCNSTGWFYIEIIPSTSSSVYLLFYKFSSILYFISCLDCSFVFQFEEARDYIFFHDYLKNSVREKNPGKLYKNQYLTTHYYSDIFNKGSGKGGRGYIKVPKEYRKITQDPEWLMSDEFSSVVQSYHFELVLKRSLLRRRHFDGVRIKQLEQLEFVKAEDVLDYFTFTDPLFKRELYDLFSGQTFI